jgi:hypothetical protein
MPAIGDSQPEKCSARIESPQSGRKAAKLALTAVMRKLLGLANALLKDNRTWTPKSLHQDGYYKSQIAARALFFTLPLSKCKSL